MQGVIVEYGDGGQTDGSTYGVRDELRVADMVLEIS